MPPLHSSISPAASPVAFHTARIFGKGRKFSTDLWKTREAEGGFNEKRAERWGKSARGFSFWAGFPYNGSLQGLLLRGERETFPPGGGLRERAAAQIREAG